LPKITYKTQEQAMEMSSDIEIKIDYSMNPEFIADTILVTNPDFFSELFVLQKKFYIGSFKLPSYYSINIEIPNSNLFL
jgi:hypothetical protein